MQTIMEDPSGAVIGLDFDGTLSPIVSDPAKAAVHPAAPPVLAELARRVRAVAIVTGRPVETVLGLGPGLADVPGLVVLGHYGFERWEGGTVSAPPPPAGVPRAQAELPLLLDRLGLERVGVEDKGRAVAVHTRNAPDPQGAFDALRGPLAELAERAGLVVEPGRFVLELRPPGMDKGHALSLFLAERAARSVLFAGDDLGDLAAFEAVRSSGLPGVTVCSGSAEVTELAGRADLVVDGPGGVVELLKELLAGMDRPF
jgi:trehalose 6-phosphate phosphatase